MMGHQMVDIYIYISWTGPNKNKQLIIRKWSCDQRSYY